MSAWLLLALLGLSTFGLRAAVPVGFGDRPVPEALTQLCALAAPAVLAALLGGSVVRGAVDQGAATAVPLAAGVAVAWRAGSTLAVLGAGLAAHVALAAIS